MTRVDRVRLVRLGPRIERVVPFGSELVPSFNLATGKPHPCGVIRTIAGPTYSDDFFRERRPIRVYAGRTSIWRLLMEH
jgi:hypothetical protein